MPSGRFFVPMEPEHRVSMPELYPRCRAPPAPFRFFSKNSERRNEVAVGDGINGHRFAADVSQLILCQRHGDDVHQND